MQHERNGYADIGLSGEKNDCVIRAVSVAGCLDYAEVHKLFETHGRKSRHTTKTHISTNALKELFPDAERITLSPMMVLNKFVSAHPTGHYVIFTTTHALALCDGVVFDWRAKPRCMVKYYWQLA